MIFKSSSTSAAKQLKPAHPGGLLPRFKTDVEAPTLWKKVLSNGQGVVTMAQTKPTIQTDTRFADLYGGLSDEDESKEAAAQPLLKASKIIQVRHFTDSWL